MRSNRRLLQAVLSGTKSCHTDRATTAIVFLGGGIFFPNVFLLGFSPQNTRRRGQRLLPSDGRCTGTQKPQRRGQKLRTVSKSRLVGPHSRIGLALFFWRFSLSIFHIFSPRAFARRRAQPHSKTSADYTITATTWRRRSSSSLGRTASRGYPPRPKSSSLEAPQR
jgi:hypothetical protein